MDEFEATRQRIRNAPLAHPPEPWKLLGTLPIGDIMEVGFAEDSEMALVLTGHNRELIDCRLGRRIARDPGVEHRSSWYGAHDLIGQGFGPMVGRHVRLAGAGGGGLPTLTRDGWGAIRAAVDWPQECLLLTAPYSSIFHPEAAFWKVAAVREPVAWGFSYTGKTLLAATAEAITIFARE